MASRSYFTVEVGLGAPVEEMTELAGEESIVLEGAGAGSEELGSVLDGMGGLTELEGRSMRVAGGIEKPGE